jgi:hypothetical protein
LGPSFTGPIHEIDAEILESKLILSVLSLYHPLRPLHAAFLGVLLFKRYALSNQRDDLDKSILYFAGSLLFSPPWWLSQGPMIGTVLFRLAISLLMRSNVSKEPKDAFHAASYLHHLSNPAHAHFAFLREPVTLRLVEAFAIQMVLKTSDVVQTLEKMAVLTHELLTLNPSSAPTTRAISAISQVLSPDLPFPFPDQPLNKIVECLRLARIHKPEIREVPLLLAKCLQIRYYNNLGNELNEAVSILDELIASGPPGDEFVTKCQKLLADLAGLLSTFNGRPENSEEAIYRARAFLASSSPEGALHPTWSRILEKAANDRFENFGPIGGLGQSSSRLPSRPVPSEEHPLSGLLEGIRNDSITDIDEAIERGRSVLASCRPSDTNVPVLLFGVIFVEAYKRTNKIEYLNESIDTLRQLLARPLPKVVHIAVCSLLSSSLATRSQISPVHRMEDIHETVELFPHIINDTSGLLSLPYRFHFACFWVSVARATQHPSVPTVYETAFSLMQDALLFAPTLQLQHGALFTSSDDHLSMPLDYASYQLDLGKIEKAIETLERGRSLLWSEMRHLRTSTDQLLGVDLDLGDKFAAVSRELEELTKSIPPSHELGMHDVVADDLMAGDQFGRLLMRQRGLLKERDELILKIRESPGFDRFLTPPSFDTLRFSASSGPVIIINHSKSRSDILILLHNAPPSIIPTPADFYDRANTLKGKLMGSRAKDGLDSSKYDQTLASVLAELYKLVGEPVIDRLRLLQVPDHSRIWWCPTSVFCSLPLHAMGPIPLDDGELRYLISTSLLIPHRCPHSSNLVTVTPVPDLRIALPYFSWRNRTHHFQPLEAKSKSSGRSIPRSRVSSQQPQHQQRSSMDSSTTNLSILRAMAPLRQANHSRRDSNSTATGALHCWRSCARICPLRSSHFFLRVIQPR